MDIVAQQFKEYCKNWIALRNVILQRGRYSEEDIKYQMAFRWFMDWSLIYDDGLFRFKPPFVMLNMWSSSISGIERFMNDLIDLEQRHSKMSGGVTNFELDHIAGLKSVIYFVLKKKWPEMDLAARRKLMAGDFRRSRYISKPNVFSITIATL